MVVENIYYRTYEVNIYLYIMSEMAKYNHSVLTPDLSRFGRFRAYLYKGLVSFILVKYFKRFMTLFYFLFLFKIHKLLRISIKCKYLLTCVYDVYLFIIMTLYEVSSYNIFLDSK